ncbi:siderophore-interacting protein [Solimicrobium silvestre]|uniref:Siderophore-interacting protein n=1 Tax=Solimicrobium silvestre TaxID=2099400 RepID=A0A2S9H2C8_9BURK|nr:siderophore-interacting protein [Solimicrobium silvestre]PRC94103.1 Siderophore-interacting protein [Solimicrobium silvestre]
MSIDLAASRVQRIRYEIKRRVLQVVRVESVSPHFKSVTFAGDALSDFISASFDDHVKFILSEEGAEEEMRRDYTPRYYNAAACELTLEFALHGDGPAADWAAQAEAGQRATIAGPRGSFIIPMDYDWHLLVGDETAVPAIARRLEELPATAHAIVVLQLADVSDRRKFQSAAKLDLHWVSNSAELMKIIRALKLPDGEGYAWCAGEASEMAALRRLLVEEKGHSRHAIRAAAYWKRGTVGHHENLEE